MAEVIATPLAELDPPRFRGRKMLAGWLAVAIAGFVVLAIGLAVDPARTWLSYLMAFAFAFTTVVGGLILLMISYATNARWMAVVRRTMEAVTLPMPALAVLFVPLLFGLRWLYPWHTPPAHADAHELAILDHRRAFLNTPFFAIRAVAYFAVLIVAASLLRRWSLRRERAVSSGGDSEEALGRERRLSSAMLPAVGLAFTFAVIDWLMTLQGLWSSSMFPVELFGGGFLAAIAAVTLLTERVWAHHGAHAITENHFYALGRLLFAFVVFWAYAAFFQALLIRIANKPEEVTFYLLRIDGAWAVFVWTLILGHFAVPFLVLMPKRVKFRPRAMAVASGWLLFMHLVEIYWLIIPAHVQGQMVFHWLDLGALAAVIGTSLAVAAWRQHGVPIIATQDPFFADGAAYRSPL